MVRISNLYLQVAHIFLKISGEELCTLEFSQCKLIGNYCSNNSQENFPPYTSRGDDNVYSYTGLNEPSGTGVLHLNFSTHCM